MKLGKTQIVVGNNGKEMSNKRAARGKLLLCQSKPTDFLSFSSPSPSSLLKLPNRDLKIRGGRRQRERP